jgi:hypothetical protein
MDFKSTGMSSYNGEHVSLEIKDIVLQSNELL